MAIEVSLLWTKRFNFPTEQGNFFRFLTREVETGRMSQTADKELPLLTA